MTRGDKENSSREANKGRTQMAAQSSAIAPFPRGNNGLGRDTGIGAKNITYDASFTTSNKLTSTPSKKHSLQGGTVKVNGFFSEGRATVKFNGFFGEGREERAASSGRMGEEELRGGEG